MRWKSIGLGLVVLAGLGAGLGFAWPFAKRDAALKLPGIVEIQEVQLAARVPGRVKEVLVNEGDHVKAGQVLVRLEVPELEAQREVLRAKLLEAEADLKKAEYGPRDEEKEAAREAAKAAAARHRRLKAGFRDEEVRQARSEHAAAETDVRLAEAELGRLARVFPVAAARTEYDAAKATVERNKSRLAAAKARKEMLEKGSREEEIEEAEAERNRARAAYRLLLAGTRPEDLAVARARVGEARARLRELEVNLREATVVAAEPSVVEVVGVRKGAVVAANQPLVRVLRAADLWVKIYVPETDLGKVRLGQGVGVTVDGYPGRRFEGRVTHVGAHSEFTPRNVQSIDDRRHQVFGVRVRVDDPQGVFKSGMAAEVTVPLQD